ASSTVPKAVSTITSTSGLRALAARRTSRPVSPGIFRSVRTRSRPPACSRSRAPRPSEATTTRYPARVSVRSRLSRSPGSSSATSSVAASGMDCPLAGEPDGEGHPAPGVVAPADLAAVLLDDLRGDGQPEPRALGLGGEEGLEESLRDLVGDAASAVRHVDLHRLAVVSAGDGQLAPTGERLQPVLHQVQDGLAQES